MDTMQSDNYYFIGIKLGNQPWSVSRIPFILKETQRAKQLSGQYISSTLFRLEVARHQRKCDCLFAILKTKKSIYSLQLIELKYRLNAVQDECEYEKIENVVLVCKLPKEKLEKNIKHCVKKMVKYYSSMYRKRIHKFEYIKKQKEDDLFMIDLHTFEDTPINEYGILCDSSFNKITRYSVTFSCAYFSISQ
jgi:hypothetical protein